MSILKYFTFRILFIFIVFVVSVYPLDNLHIIDTYQKSSLSMLKPQSYKFATNISYEYIYFKASGGDNNTIKPTLLFLHGFPSSFHCWRHQIEHFSRQGYGCLAPNMMGYGKTYSPLNTDEYRAKLMVEHLAALLDHLHLSKVFVVGHDWGTRPGSRFLLYYPQRTLGLILISVGYIPPGMLDLDQILENTKQAFGYETFGYWKFFAADDCATIIENNPDSFLDLLFTSDPIQWKTDLAPVGKAREWVTNGRRTTRASYMTKDDYKIFRQYIDEGMQAKLNWYKAAIENVDWEDEMNMDPTMKLPVLFIGAKNDYVSLIPTYSGQKQYIADLETVELETGHWAMEENPEAVNRVINAWIKKIMWI